MRPPAWLGRAVRTGFLALALLLLVLALRDNGSEALAAVRDVGIASALASLAAALLGLLASAMVWRALLADLGTSLPLRPALHVFFLGQLGKYVPGSVFAIAAQMELGRSQGAPRSRVGTASLLFMGVLVAAGLLTAALALPLTSPDALRDFAWVLLVLPLALLVLHPPVLSRLVDLLLRVLRRDPLERPLSRRGVGAATGWALVMWAAYGVHLWLLVRPQDTQGRADLLLLSLGAYALAWTAGFLFVVAPAGAGVREVALVAGLAPVLDRPAALAVAVLSRVLMTLGDLLWGAAGAGLTPRSRKQPGPGGAVVTTVIPVQQLGKAADD
ncbi:MAG: lysylphosphatidylglycerol synthase domain-containing protein [Mycobacteriales bacterium]